MQSRENLPARRQEPQFLMSRPQPLGVLPTLWFWREVRTERPLVGIATGLFMGVFALVMSQTFLVWLSLPVAFLVALFLPYFALGLVERGLRRMVLHRRRTLARSGPQETLPPADERL